jgi:EmrB/QacA subfamily drug resistance transporter
MSPDTHPYQRRWQALIVLSVSLLVITVGNTILNVALPTVQRELDASSSQLQWIVDGYLLVYAGLLLAAGTLGDRFGRKRALMTGLTLFAIGSVSACLAGSSIELIASRALMGVGAAGIMPTTLSILTNIFPSSERPKAIAIWSAVVGIGVAIGPVAGGWMIEHLTWRWIFLFNLPAIAACLIGAVVLVPESRDPAKPKLDVVGAALSVAGLTSVVWGLIEAPDRGWSDPVIVGAFAIGAAVLAAFAVWERRVEQPMLELSMFRNARFSAASASITFVYFALMGVMYFMSTYLQTVLGFGALGAGERMLPIAAGMVPAAKAAVPLTRRLGTKAVVATGLGIGACALFLVSGFAEATTDAELCLTLGLMGVGMGLAMAPATESIMGSLPRAKAGIGSAMNDVVREVGGTLGIAVLGSLLASAYASGMDGATAGLSPDAASAASDSVGAAHQVAAQTGAADLVAAANGAFVDAMGTAAGVAAAVAVAGALIAALFLPARARAKSPSSGTALPEPAAA